MAAEYKLVMRTLVTVREGDRVTLDPTRTLTNAMGGRVFDDHLYQECVVESIELPQPDKWPHSPYVYVRFEDGQTAAFPVDYFVLPEETRRSRE